MEEFNLEQFLDQYDDTDNTPIEEDVIPTPVDPPKEDLVEPEEVDIIDTEEEEEEEEDIIESIPVKEEDSKTPTPTEVNTGDKSDDVNIYQQYYDLLSNNEYLSVSDDFKFDGTAEGLASAIEQSKVNMQKNVASAIMQKLPEDFKPLFRYALSGGKDIKKYLDTFKDVDIADIELEGNVQNQKYVIKEYFKRTSPYSDERIDRIVDRLQVAGELESEASKALEDLTKIGEEERLSLITKAEAKTAQEEQERLQFKKTINIEIDSGKLIPKARKGKVKAFIFNVQKYQDGEDTQFNKTLRTIASNPEHVVQLADLLLDYDSKTGFNLKRFTKKAATKAASNLKEQLESMASNNRNNISAGSVADSTIKDFDFEAFLAEDF